MGFVPHPNALRATPSPGHPSLTSEHRPFSSESGGDDAVAFIDNILGNELIFSWIYLIDIVVLNVKRFIDEFPNHVRPDRLLFALTKNTVDMKLLVVIFSVFVKFNQLSVILHSSQHLGIVKVGDFFRNLFITPNLSDLDSSYPSFHLHLES